MHKLKLDGNAASGASAVAHTRRLLALVTPLMLCGCQVGVLDPRGPIASAERLILLDSTVIMLAVILPVIAMTFGFAWWFRAGNRRARYLPDWSYSGKLEFIVWAIPALVVLFLGGIAWVSSHDLDPQKPIESSAKPLTVDVVSLDWKWLFIYPAEGLASVNELVVPAGVPLEFHLTSATVMNSFFVPQLGSQIVTMFGMVSRLNLQADAPGMYPGLSAQFSGDGFSGMHFNVRALPADSYVAWLSDARGKGRELDAAAYTELAKSSSNVAPETFRGVEPGLFEHIVGMGDAPAANPPKADAMANPSLHSGN